MNERLRAPALVALAGLEPRPDLPLIYVVGAPRSGTTLAAQMIAQHLQVGAINNLIARFWDSPAVGIALSGAVLNAKKVVSQDLHSQHGRTSGLAGTHEFGHFWRRWLGLDQATTHRLTSHELSSVDVGGLRRALQRDILGAFAKPVLWRNVICGLNARFLTRVHPCSLFVEFRRDPLHVAASILRCRRERFGRYDHWWSLKPRAFEHLAHEADPARQVAAQVLECRREMDEELSCGSVHRLTIEYDGFCRDPNRALGLLCEALLRLGVTMSPPEGPIAPISPAPCPAVEDQWLARLRTSLDELMQESTVRVPL